MTPAETLERLGRLLSRRNALQVQVLKAERAAGYFQRKQKKLAQQLRAVVFDIEVECRLAEVNQ